MCTCDALPAQLTQGSWYRSQERCLKGQRSRCVPGKQLLSHFFLFTCLQSLLQKTLISPLTPQKPPFIYIVSPLPTASFCFGIGFPEQAGNARSLNNDFSRIYCRGATVLTTKVRRGTNVGTEGSLGKIRVQGESESFINQCTEPLIVAGMRKVTPIHIYQLQQVPCATSALFPEICPTHPSFSHLNKLHPLDVSIPARPWPPDFPSKPPESSLPFYFFRAFPYSPPGTSFTWS